MVYSPKAKILTATWNLMRDDALHATGSSAFPVAQDVAE
jgi:hypothetical protein